MENGKNSTHLWRCMNCGAMTDKDICDSCGERSCIKSEPSDNKYAKPQNGGDTVKPADTAAGDSEGIAAVGKDVKSAVMLAGENASEETRKVKKLLLEVCGITLVLVIAAVFMCYKMSAKIDKLETANADLKTALNSGISKIKTEISSLKTGDEKQPEKQQESEQEKTDTEETGTEETANEAEVKTAFKYYVHTVKPGEYLEKICSDYGINYAANKNIILAVNGITNQSVINVGQTLIIPCFDAE
ncbi:MAG: LysM peptidoglycan-binding domain-containing protein [Clostridia bacterium]|nr:LysM peptidoglycan-binding domain-containing protein [Clostridia bacterium]